MAVTFGAGPISKTGVPQLLFDARAYENGFAVSPDRQRLLLMPLISSEQ